MKNVLSGLKFRLLVMIGVVLTIGSGIASAGATLPSTGCDIGALITAGITAMGAVAAVAVGGFVAFKVVKKGLTWVGRAMG